MARVSHESLQYLASVEQVRLHGAEDVVELRLASVGYSVSDATGLQLRLLQLAHAGADVCTDTRHRTHVPGTLDSLLRDSPFNVLLRLQIGLVYGAASWYLALSVHVFRTTTISHSSVPTITPSRTGRFAC